MSDGRDSEIRCPYCGAVNTVGVFCQECGKRIRNETPEPIVNSVTSYPPPQTINNQYKTNRTTKTRGTHKLVLAALIGVLAVGLVFGALSFSLLKAGSTPSSGSATPQPTSASPTLTPSTPPPTFTPTATPAPTPTAAQSIEITGINLQINYGTSDRGYFGATTQTVTISNQPNQILTVNGGAQFFLYFTLTESSSATTDSISSVTAGTPGFTLVSVQPQTPIAFSPGGSTQITVTLIAPQTAFNGPVQLILTTSGASPTSTQPQQ